MDNAIEALLQTDDGSGWLLMTDPVRVVEARTPGAVVATIREAEDAAASHDCYAVGFVRYEAGAAFGLSVREGAHELPLAWFALFLRVPVI